MAGWMPGVMFGCRVRSSRGQWRTSRSPPPSSELRTMEIGHHCDLGACRQLSFLPITCPLCGGKFCEQHSKQDDHACGGGRSALSPEAQAAGAAQGRRKCAKVGCRNTSLALQTDKPVNSFVHAAPQCPQCHLSFCPSHALPARHQCTAPPPPTLGDAKRAQYAAEATARDAKRAHAREMLAKRGFKKKT